MKTQGFYLATIAVLLLLIVYLYSSWQDARESVASARAVIEEKDAVIKYYKNDRDKIVAEKQAVEISVKEFEEFYKNDAKRLKEDFNVRLRDLKAYIQAEFQANGSGEATVIHNHYVDSTGKVIKWRDFNFSDGYLQFSSVIYDSLKEAVSSYTYSDTITYAFAVKKKWIFGDEKLYGYGMLGNKNARVTASTNVLIKDYKDKRFVVSAGVSYAPFSDSKIQPTITLGYAIFKF